MVAGHFTDAWGVKFKGICYQVHRIIWGICNGVIAEGIIDHIDGNPRNNKIANLRLVTYKINNRNSKKSSDNNSGITGVYYSESINKYNVLYRYFCAQWTDTKQHCKKFSINKLGITEAFKRAVLYRKLKFSELPDYTERHGL